MSNHGLILGPSGCGKTTLARNLVEAAHDAGVNVLVLDPSMQQWDADFQTDDTDEFCGVVFSNERCLVIVDEAGEALGKHFSSETRHRMGLATRSRHRGHTVFFIGQRPTFIHADIRGQCQQAFVFRPNYKYDRQIYQDLFGDDASKIYDLQRGECLHFKPGDEPTMIKVL